MPRAKSTRQTVAASDCYHFRWKHEVHLVPLIYVDTLGVKRAAIDWSTHDPRRAPPGRCRICGRMSLLALRDCQNRPCHKTCAEAELLAGQS